LVSLYQRKATGKQTHFFPIVLEKPGFRVSQEDAFRVTRLKPDFKKGWFLLAKALWKDSAGGGLVGVLDLHGGNGSCRNARLYPLAMSTVCELENGVEIVDLPIAW
jgi:hypothetical protein